MEKQLGKITKVYLGIGGYQDSMLGLSFELGGEGWGVMTEFAGTWCPGLVDVTERTKWTEEDRTKHLANAMRTLGETLLKAKKTRAEQLVGVPVEAVFEGMALKSWLSGFPC